MSIGEVIATLKMKIDSLEPKMGKKTPIGKNKILIAFKSSMKFSLRRLWMGLKHTHSSMAKAIKLS